MGRGRGVRGHTRYRSTRTSTLDSKSPSHGRSALAHLVGNPEYDLKMREVMEAFDEEMSHSQLCQGCGLLWLDSRKLEPCLLCGKITFTEKLPAANFMEENL